MRDEKQLLIAIKSKIDKRIRPFLLRIQLNKYIDTISSIGNVSVGKTWPRPKMEHVSKAQKIMVLSPHPDDDVIGCGGTLKILCENGSIVKTIIFTDGCMGDGTVKDFSLVTIRKHEAIAGSKILGYHDLIFLNNLDTKLRANEKNKDAMLQLLRDFNPEQIFVPSILERHPDHIETAVILAHALQKYVGHPLCYCYEVWSPLFPNTLIDITNKVDDKIKAISAHWSQVTHQNYLDSILGLNAFRAMGLGYDVKFCEAFYKCSKEEYIKMVLKHF